MRKWKVIALTTIVIIAAGVMALVISRPKKGTLKYHIAECRAAQHEYLGDRTLVDFLRDKCRDLLGLENPGIPHVRYDVHIKALLDLGYLEKQEFRVEDLPRVDVYRAVMVLAAKELPRDRVWRIRWDTETYIALVVEAEPRDIEKWQEIVRKVDAPWFRSVHTSELKAPEDRRSP